MQLPATMTPASREAARYLIDFLHFNFMAVDDETLHAIMFAWCTLMVIDAPDNRHEDTQRQHRATLRASYEKLAAWRA